MSMLRRLRRAAIPYGLKPEEIGPDIHLLRRQVYGRVCAQHASQRGAILLRLHGEAPGTCAARLVKAKPEGLVL
jgi:hypothetical protein